MENKENKDLGEQLAALQRACKENNLPVLFMIDGWESSGRGAVMNDLVRKLDAKTYQVSVFDTYEKGTYAVPTQPFWSGLPAKGEFAIFDRSLYYPLLNDLKMPEDETDRRLRRVMETERLLHDDGVLLFKFFLDMTQKGQREAIKELAKDPYRRILVSAFDREQNKQYEAYRKRFDKILDRTGQPFAPWRIVPGEDRKKAIKTVLKTCIAEIEKALQNRKAQAADPGKERGEAGFESGKPIAWPCSSFPTEDAYRKKRKALQEEAAELAYGLYARGIPSVLVFEGVDAAGKGGAIARLIRRLDARGYAVNPTSAPTDREKEHHYLWRFYNNFPAAGKMAIFDRSWYGRVMVERVEGFATEAEWSRAYREINEMERELTESGVLVLKFFLMISKEEQARRFEAREREKAYKITEEDWRNRDKWEAYLQTFEDMFAKTSTAYAPWILLETDEKRQARIGVLEAFVEGAGRALKKAGKEKPTDR